MKHFAVHVGAGYFKDSNVDKLKLLCEHACQKVVSECTAQCSYFLFWPNLAVTGLCIVSVS